MPNGTNSGGSSQNNGMTVNVGKLWEHTRSVLALLVIPLLMWGIKLEVGNAERDLLLTQLAGQITDLKAEVKEAQDIDDKVQSNAVKLAILEGKLDTANGRLGEIKELLR